LKKKKKKKKKTTGYINLTGREHIVEKI
jgi:hypothetical protein